MKAFKFVHAADLHLDSPFRAVGLADERIAQSFREATFQSFQNIVQVCIDETADFLLVAGDIYDEANRSMSTQFRFRDELAKLAAVGIRAFVVHGNHDPLSGRSLRLSYPHTVHVFGADYEVKDLVKDGEVVARIHGISYPERDVTENLARRFKRTDDSLLHIGLLHCNLDGNADHGAYAPCSTRELADSGLDYWALGHIHRRDLRAGTPVIVYPGNCQGRHIRETAEKGCVVVDVDPNGRATPRFVATDAVRWFELRQQLGGIDDEAELIEKLDDQIEASLDGAEGRHVALRIYVEGRGKLFPTLREKGVDEELRETLRQKWSGATPFAWIEEVKLEVRPEVDFATLRREPSFLGEVLRRFEEARTEEGLARMKELLEGDRSVFGKRGVRNLLGELSKEELRSVLAEAEAQCLKHLLQEQS